MKKLIAMLLALALVFSFAACAETTNDPAASKPSEPQQQVKDYSAIAGEYLLDASNLGMPMKWFIKITADGKFQIATDRAYATLKGEGDIGDKDGTYMFVYSDNTAENPKTATFTIENKNLVFSTNVPIGAASVSPNVEEGKYPTAKIIAHEDIQGVYLGEYEKAAMGSTVVYSYELTLGNGLEYTFSSSFSMMGGAMTRTETGTFAIDGTKISFTALTVDGEAVEAPAAVDGTIADNKITAAFKLSAMASEAQEVEARLGIYAEVAGTYTGLYEKAMGPMVLSYGCKLELDAFGGYKFTTISITDISALNRPFDPEAVDYSEEGTYTYEAGKFALQPAAENATAQEATLANYVLNAKFPISAMVPNAVDLALYAEEVSGTFTDTAADEEGKMVYTAKLELLGNRFTLTVTDENAEAVSYVAKGTFEIKKAMMTTVELTTTELTAFGAAVAEIPAELATVSCPVNESGINAELIFNIDDTATLGFQLAK